MPTSTIITFAGLLVFRRDLNTGQYEVGTLRARDAHDSHILQIEISPDPSTGQGLLVIPPDDLERHIRDGNVVWQLEVEGSPSPGIQATPGKPNDRKNPTTSNDKDLGWIVNLENDEFHNGPLTRTPNALQPIIGLQQGILFTSCKTDSVVTIQGDFAQDFGFITGGISLTIDTSAGQKPELNVFDQQGTKVNELLHLQQTEQVSYQIFILNTPLPGTMTTESHFHLYYDRLFQGVPENERFDLRLLRPRVPPPNDRCPEGNDKRTPNPFKCGGILVEGGPPLG